MFEKAKPFIALGLAFCLVADPCRAAGMGLASIPAQEAIPCHVVQQQALIAKLSSARFLANRLNPSAYVAFTATRFAALPTTWNQVTRTRPFWEEFLYRAVPSSAVNTMMQGMFHTLMAMQPQDDIFWPVVILTNAVMGMGLFLYSDLIQRYLHPLIIEDIRDGRPIMRPPHGFEVEAIGMSGWAYMAPFVLVLWLESLLTVQAISVGAQNVANWVMGASWVGLGAALQIARTWHRNHNEWVKQNRLEGSKEGTLYTATRGFSDPLAERLVELAQSHKAANDKELYQRIPRYVGLTKGTAVDIGWGGNRFVTEGLYSAGLKQVIAVDSKIGTLGPWTFDNPKLIQADALQLPLAEQSVDLVIFNRSLFWLYLYAYTDAKKHGPELWPKTEQERRSLIYRQSLKEALRVLRDRGHLIVRFGISNRQLRREEALIDEAVIAKTLIHDLGFEDIEVLSSKDGPVLLWARKKAIQKPYRFVRLRKWINTFAPRFFPKPETMKVGIQDHAVVTKPEFEDNLAGLSLEEMFPHLRGLQGLYVAKAEIAEHARLAQGHRFDDARFGIGWKFNVSNGRDEHFRAVRVKTHIPRRLWHRHVPITIEMHYIYERDVAGQQRALGMVALPEGELQNRAAGIGYLDTLLFELRSMTYFQQLAQRQQSAQLLVLNSPFFLYAYENSDTLKKTLDSLNLQVDLNKQPVGKNGTFLSLRFSPKPAEEPKSSLLLASLRKLILPFWIVAWVTGLQVSLSAQQPGLGVFDRESIAIFAWASIGGLVFGALMTGAAYQLNRWVEHRSPPQVVLPPKPSSEEIVAYERIANALIEDIERELPEGGTITLSGAAGIGKTTLSLVLAELLKKRGTRSRIYDLDKALLPASTRRSIEFDAVAQQVTRTDDFHRIYSAQEIERIVEGLKRNHQPGDVDIIDASYALISPAVRNLPGPRLDIYLEGDLNRARRLFRARSEARYLNDSEFIENRMRYYDLVTHPSQEAYATEFAPQFKLRVILEGPPKDWRVEPKSFMPAVILSKPWVVLSVVLLAATLALQFLSAPSHPKSRALDSAA